uniref:Uncharacterized protein n=1 Tax=Pelusios castaneus TaxID=367368 RepID=A0A8C8RYL6_9SAUR
MASASPVQEIQEETKCPICLEYLTDPVNTHCGHNFCQACITQYCEKWDEPVNGPLCCPNCRERIQKGALRNNYQLANIVEKIKHLDYRQGTENLCRRHHKALDLFCEEDGEAVCVVCWRSPEHRSHTVLLLEEAAPKYKLRQSQHRLSHWRLGHVTVTQETLSIFLIQKRTEIERQKIVSEFQQLQQFLEEQERLLLAQLEKLEKEIVKIQNENVTKFSAEISRLSEMISEMEGKCQKPESEFLQVGLKHNFFLCRCAKGNFQEQKKISPELEKRLGDFSQKTVALMETLRKFKGQLGSETWSQPPPGLSSAPNALILPPVTVTLDPDTAHPDLVLSEDGKRVRWDHTQQDLPNNPERFDTEPCVLGRAGFTSGRHCWEVEVGDGLYWAVGVARESVRRKGQISHSPEGGIWAVRRWEDQFEALTSPVTPLPQSRAPSRIRVCLDCDRGQVTFFGAGDEAPIFTFPLGSRTPHTGNRSDSLNTVCVLLKSPVLGVQLHDFRF